MTRPLLGLLIAFLSLAAQADEPWFKLVQSKDGYLAGGRLHGALWSFRVPGKEIKAIGNGQPPMFSIDGVVIQVLAVPPEDYGRSAAHPLEAQKKYEQDYLRKTFPGVKFSDHDFCKNASVPHGGWTAEVPASADKAPNNLKSYQRTPSQVFNTFQVADVVLVVNSTYGSDADRQAMALKLDAICRSFTRER